MVWVSNKNFYSGNANDIIKNSLGYKMGTGIEFPFKDKFKARIELNFTKISSIFEYGNMYDFSITCGLLYTLGKKDKPKDESGVKKE